jgi:hypothetical protein
VVIAVVAVTLGVLAWNAAQFHWLQSYDAYASWQYKNVVSAGEHRLPRKSETDVWHNPPLFFVVAGQIERVAWNAGFTTPSSASRGRASSCCWESCSPRSSSLSPRSHSSSFLRLEAMAAAAYPGSVSP